MRFAFQRLRLSDGSLDCPRPLLNVSVVGPRRHAPALMLVDSGSSETMLPKRFLEALGVQFSGEKSEVSSFCAERHEAEVAAVTLRFGGGRFEVSTRVLGFPGQCVPVLGLRDFFGRYVVSFDAGGLSFFVSEPRHTRQN